VGESGDISGPDRARLGGVLAGAQRRGFLGPGPLDPQISHSLGFVAGTRDLDPPAPPAPGRALDLGTGGGLPGLVMALAMPTWRWTLLEGSRRRAEFLDGAIRDLGIEGRVQVLAARAEEAGRGPLRGSQDLVVARAFGAPPVTAECGAPFLRIGGLLLVSEPPPPHTPRWPSSALSTLGLVARRRLSQPISLQVLQLEVECPDVYPRRVGVPAKRHLW
jgi:16S rRNA (guanine527-N7)-methyltransferase